MDSHEPYLIDVSDIPAGLTLLRCDGQTVEPLCANDAFFELVGYERNATNGKHYPTPILATEGWRSFTAQLLSHVRAGKTTFHVDARQKTSNNASIWARTRCSYNPKEHLATCIVIDATSTVETSTRLRMSEDAFRIAVRMSGKCIATYDMAARTLTMENGTESKILAPLLQENVPESTIAAGGVAPESIETYRALFHAIHEGTPGGSVDLCMRDFGSGEFRWLQADYSTVFDGEGQPASAVIVFDDITEQRERERAQKTLAERDALTGVLNRATFEYRCTKLIELTPSGRQHAFVMADLDRLKATNDSLGHAAGDQAIATAADALSGVLRDCDLVGRIGGDEFMVCLRDVKSRDAAGAVARRMCRAVLDETTALHAPDDSAPTISLGIALFPQDGTTYDELYHNADVAMYRAKRCGGNGFDFYSNEQAHDIPSHSSISASSHAPI